MSREKSCDKHGFEHKYTGECEWCYHDKVNAERVARRKEFEEEASEVLLMMNRLSHCVGKDDWVAGRGWVEKILLHLIKRSYGYEDVE